MKKCEVIIRQAGMARVIERAREMGRAEGAAAAQAQGLAPAPPHNMDAEPPAPLLVSMPSSSKAPQTALGTMLHNNDNI